MAYSTTPTPVLGIDFGNDSSSIAVLRNNQIYMLEKIPSEIGDSIFGFKRLLGKNFDDPAVEHELRCYPPYEITLRTDNTIRVKKLDHLDQDNDVFSIQQLTAMFFTKLKEKAEASLKCQVKQCVMSVPSFFGNAERLALLYAATNAGLKLLRIFNDTTATALAYGYVQHFDNLDEPPRNVVFVDFGHTALQVSVCSFNCGKLTVLASEADPQLGGRDIDIILAEHFSQNFKSQYDIDPTKDSRAMVRLLKEVKNFKALLSANSTELQLNIKSFMNDKDLRAVMNLVDMEKLCACLFERVETTLLKCLKESKLEREQIHSIEVAGGCSRIPAMKLLIEKLFGRAPNSTLDQDTAVANGCALWCALLCSGSSSRKIIITDIQNYQIKFEFKSESPSSTAVTTAKLPIPYRGLLNISQRKADTVRIEYNGQLIGIFEVKKCDKVKLRVDRHGIITATTKNHDDNARPRSPPTKKSKVENIKDNENDDILVLKKEIDKIIEELKSTDLAMYISPLQKRNISAQIRKVEKFLFEKKNCSRESLIEKKNNLQELSDPLKKRKHDYETLLSVLEEFNTNLRKEVDLYMNNDEKYLHIGRRDWEKIRELTENTLLWVKKYHKQLSTPSRSTNPRLSSDLIVTEKNKYEQAIQEILINSQPQPQVAATEFSSEATGKSDTLANTSVISTSFTDYNILPKIENLINSNEKISNTLQSYEEKQSDLHGKIEEVNKKLDDIMKAASANAMNSVAPEIMMMKKYPEAYVEFLIEQGEVQQAILEVLHASETKILMHLCQKLGVDETTFPEIFPQDVLLPFLEKLSFDLNDQTHFKFQFIQRAVTCLDKNHPFCQKNFPKILPAVRSRIENYIRKNPTNNNTQIKLLVIALNAFIGV